MQWKRSPRFKNYEVSETGLVRRLTGSRTRKKGHMPKGSVSTVGYLRFTLIANNGQKVAAWAHRLALETFIGPRPSHKHQAAHYDGNHLNNHYSNLRWATSKENHDDQIRHGTTGKGVKNGRAKLTEQQVFALKKEFLALERCPRGSIRPGKLKALRRKYDLDQSTVYAIVSGKRWGHLNA